MTFEEAALQVIMGAVGSLGFSLLFNIRGRMLLFAALGGAMGWTVYLLLGGEYPNDQMQYMLAAMAATLYAEVLARILRVPVTVFCVCSLIPLIPGGSLYYTMAYCLQGDNAGFYTRGIYTLTAATMLALGTMAVMMLTRVYTMTKARVLKRAKMKKRRV